jgi:hypothetical protein
MRVSPENKFITVDNRLTEWVDTAVMLEVSISKPAGFPLS